jgi:hypothetical protein
VDQHDGSGHGVLTDGSARNGLAQPNPPRRSSLGNFGRYAPAREGGYTVKRLEVAQRSAPVGR